MEPDPIVEELVRHLDAHAPIPLPASFAEGTRFGEWRLTAFLGKGAGGEVYRAERSGDSAVAALKIHVLRADADDARKEIARRRFEREAQLVAENVHPFFPRFHGRGTDHGCPYFAMELLEPVTLPGEDAAVAAFLLRISRALGILHARGLVHRDVKPQNIMYRPNGECVLIDLGLVKAMPSAAAEPTVTVLDGKAAGAGTPRYAAPEQFNGGVVTPAADVHALGMLANECFGGNPPRAWKRIIGRSTSSIPERRYANVRAFETAVRRRHWVRTACAFAAVAVAALGTAALATIPCRQKDSPAWRALATDVVTNVVERQLVHEELATNSLGVVTLKERVWCRMTNSVAGTVIRLNGRDHAFAEPIVLDRSRRHWIVGPGSLDAMIEGEAGTRVNLENCVLVNRTTKSLRECGVHYLLVRCAYLNFIAQDPNGGAFVENSGGAGNEFEFRGPPTMQGLLLRRQTDVLRENNR